MLAIFPQGFTVRVSQASVSPPALSTAPPHVAFSRGRVPISRLCRSIKSVAPRLERNSCWLCLPVKAVTSYPFDERISMAMLPTPPVAPVTTIGPCSGDCLFSSIRTTAIAAVNPAVPMAIASLRLIPLGKGTRQSALTLAISEYPPSAVSDNPHPQTRTSSPSL